MPAISNLAGVRKRLCGGQCVSASTIPGDNLNLLLSDEPAACRGRLPVREEADRPSPFEIADDCAVTLITPPSPIIDSDHLGYSMIWSATAPDGTQ